MKKYQIIYADPPWEVQKIQRKVRPNQVEMDYPMISLPEICNLGIGLRPFIADDCSLFLWTTHAYLPKSFQVMNEWGFKYQRTITWDKQNGMCLFGFHHRTEFLLFGYRGKIEMYPKRKAFPTIVVAKSPRHSEKPQIFRELIAPFGEPRLELFARQKVEGWDCWGNEVESDIDLCKLPEWSKGVEKVYCLRCGECCRTISPLSQLNPCSFLEMSGNIATCQIYEHRPIQCRNHEYSFAKFCPIGMDILKLDREGAVNRIAAFQEIKVVKSNER